MKQSSMPTKHSKLFYRTLTAIGKEQMQNLTISRLQMMSQIGWLRGEKLMDELVKAGVVISYPSPLKEVSKINLERARSLLHEMEAM